MDVLEAISRRTSVRSYSPEPLTPEALEQVRSAGQAAEPLTSASLQFRLCSDLEIGREVKGILGDYGKVIRAPHYVVLCAIESEGYLVDSGYRFEQMVIDATRRGIGTCWVGGFFKEATLRRAVGLDDAWRIVALTPVGTPAEAKLGGKLIRKLIGASTRKPIHELFFWERHGEPLPDSVKLDPRLARVFEATRWAPSWANKQPWRFVVRPQEVIVYKQTRQLKEDKDYHVLDCGIAMAHLHFAARDLGLRGTWALGACDVPGAPDADCVGSYRLEETISAR